VNFLDRHGLEVEAPGEGDCDPNLDCNVPGCYDPSNELLGQPDPACPTTGGGGDPDPSSTPPPVTCTYTGYTLSKQTSNAPLSGPGHYAPIYFNFSAGGGDGVYDWSDTQMIVETGALLYKGNPISVTVDPSVVYESLTNYGTPGSATPVGSANLPTASFYDSPGQRSKDRIGTIVSAFLQWTATLYVQVDGVPCGSVSWNATLTWQRGKKPQIQFGAITYNAPGPQ
jgi:hypothetical protein